MNSQRPDSALTADDDSSYSSGSSARDAAVRKTSNQVRHLWTSVRDSERFQEDVARETVRIRERLHGLARLHKEVLDQEKGSRMQYQEFHKLLAQSFERILSLTKDVHATKTELRVLWEENHVAQMRTIHELTTKLDEERLRSTQLEKSVQQMSMELMETRRSLESRLDSEHRSQQIRMESYQATVDRRIQGTMEMAIQSMTERMNLVQSALTNNVQSVRDHLQTSQQMEQSHHQNLEMSFRARLDPIADKLDSSNATLSQSVQVLNDKITQLEARSEKQVADARIQWEARVQELERKQDTTQRTQEQQQSGQQIITEDLVSAVTSLKDTLQLLTKEQARSRREMEQQWLRQLMEVRKDTQLELDRRMKSAQRDNVYVL